MLTIDPVVEELVKHLQIMAVLPGNLKLRVIVVFANEGLPFWIPVVRGYVVTNLFFLKS